MRLRKDYRPVDGTHSRIRQAADFRSHGPFFHGFRKDDIDTRLSLDFIGRKNTELNLFHTPDGRGRVGETHDELLQQAKNSKGCISKQFAEFPAV